MDVSGLDDTSTESASVTPVGLEAVPDLMADPEHRRRHAALRARLFGGAQPPGQFGRYRLAQRLGSGATGVVHEAHDPVLDRSVALKILRDPGGRDRPRLLREARALAKVVHPNVIEVFEVGELGGEAFIALELVEGTTLRAWADEQARPWPAVVDVYVQAGRGLAAAHALGLVHRDFKPDNAMRGEDGRVRVLDFGLARAARRDEPATDGPGASTLQATLTGSGVVAGTPAYMAPEVMLGAPADERSDQFALAVALFEALCGRRPFAGDTLAELAEHLEANRRVPPPAHVVLPSSLLAVIDRALLPDPAARWPDVALFVDALSATTRRARRRGSWVVPAVAAVGLSALGWALWRPGESSAQRGCRSGSEQVNAAWNARRRQAFAEHWRPADGSAPALAETVLTGLDQRVAGWSHAWSEVCRGLGDADDLAVDGRARCLRQHGRKLVGLVDALEHVPTDALRRALPLVEALPVDACTRPGEGFPLPDDPERALTVEHGVAALDRAALQCRLEGPSVCGPAVEAGLTEARTIDHAPLTALALQRAGAMVEMRGDLAGAQAHFEEAFFVARTAGHDQAAAKAAVSLVHLVGYRLHRPEDGMQWARQAEAAINGLQDDARLHGDLLNNRGLILLGQGHVEQAERDYLAAIEQYERAVPLRPASIAVTLGNLAQLAYERHDFEHALELMDRAVATQIERSGPDGHALILEFTNRSLVHTARGDLEAATSDLTRALEIGERLLGADHPDLVATLANLGAVHAKRGDYAGARALFERARALLLRVDPDHPRRLALDVQLASAIGWQGDHQAAIERLQQVLAEFRSRESPSWRNLADAELRLGVVLQLTGDCERALPHLNVALEMVEQQAGMEAQAIVGPATEIGRCHLSLGQPALALPLLERAWPLQLAAPGGAADRARTGFALAQALHATRDDRQGQGEQGMSAAAVAEQARVAYAEAGPGFASNAREVEQWLVSRSP